MKVKLNKKGYITIEVIVGAALTAIIAFFLIELTMKLVNKTDNYYEDTLITTDRALVTKNIKQSIENDISSYGIIKTVSCNSNICTITYDNNTTRNLKINGNTITYGDYKKEMDKGLNNLNLSGNKSSDYVNFKITGMNIFTDTNYDFNILITNKKKHSTVISHISNLYISNNTVVNNNITYNVDTNNNLIKDVNGNIRYYGTNPNNYIKFNCDTYPDTNCELWRIIGIVDGNLKIVRGSSIGSYSWDTSAAKKKTSGEGGDVGGGGSIVTPGDPPPKVDTQSNKKNNLYNVVAMPINKIDGGISDENLVIPGKGVNEWSKSDLMKLLNPGYETNIDFDNSNKMVTINNSLYYNRNSGKCYNGDSNSYTNCDFSASGLKDSSKDKINEVTWKTAGFKDENKFANEVITFENGTLTGKSTDGVNRKTSWKGKIAVMSTSDFGYAMDFTKCSSNLREYDSANCKSNNWIISLIGNDGTTTLINPYADTTEYSFIIYHGHLGDWNVSYAYNVFPTLYLNSSSVISSGDGTIDNPYRLS